MVFSRTIAALLIGPVAWSNIGWQPLAGNRGSVRYDADGIRL